MNVRPASDLYLGQQTVSVYDYKEKRFVFLGTVPIVAGATQKKKMFRKHFPARAKKLIHK